MAKAAPKLADLRAARDAAALEVQTLELRAKKDAFTRYNAAMSAASVGYRPGPRSRGYEVLADTGAGKGSRKLGGGGDNHLSPAELLRLRAENRDACRNNPIAAGVKACAGWLAVGTGLRFKSLSRDRVYNRWIEYAADERFERADVSGRYNQQELDFWLATEDIDAGDAFLNFLGGTDPDAGKVQMLEAEEVAPGTSDVAKRAPYGVERDYAGRLVQIFTRPFLVGMPGGKMEPPPGQVTQADGAHVFVIENRPRKSVTRGVPAIAPSVGVMWTAWSMIKAVVAAAELGAKLPIFTESDSPAATKTEFPGQYETDQRTGAEPTESKTFELPDGISMTHFSKGGKIVPVVNAHPQQQIPDFVRMIARMIGSPIGVPVELVLCELMGLSYFGGRVMLKMAYDRQAGRRKRVKQAKSWMFERWLPSLIAEYERGVYTADDVEFSLGMLSNEMIGKRRVAPADAGRHQFRDPPRVVLDPLKERQADVIGVNNNFCTKESVQEDGGFDPDACDERRALEVERDAELGITPALAPGAMPGGGNGSERDEEVPVGSAAR